MSQVLSIQDVVAERQRGVATSLVPFFRTVGGSIGVGALGGVLAAGLAHRLGSAAETAGRLLAVGSGSAANGGAPAIAPAVFRVAIERSLLPVFGVLLALSAVNLYVTRRFPDRAAKPSTSTSQEILLSVD
jgi:hypothetical protein